MGIFTKLNKSQIKKILSHYPQLPKTDFKSRGLKSGTVNTFYRISYPDKKNYFLKIDETGDRPRLDNEINIFTFLEKKMKNLDFAFPLPVKTKNGKYYLKFGGKFALLFTEVRGAPVLKSLTPGHLKIVGAKMAKLHGLKQSSKIKNHRFDLDGIKRTFSKIKNALRKKHPELVSLISKKLEFLSENAPSQFKPSLIHADLFPDNLHWKKNKLHGIIDFEAAGLGHPLFDICVAFHALCHNGKNFAVKRIKSFVLGYESKRKMDKKYLPYFMQLTALRFLVTRLKDFDLPGLNPKMKDFRDYKDYLKRFEQIDHHFFDEILS